MAASAVRPTSSAPSGSRIPEPGDRIRIRYRRPPDREQIFEQRLVVRRPDVVVTLLEHAPLSRPSTVDGRIVLEPGSSVVWFTFPGEHHDIGRFHALDDRFTGLYANVLSPVEGLDGAEWRTTDLFLDVWLAADGGTPLILDEDELEDAFARGWVDAANAAAARGEAERLVREARRGVWPPPVVAEWTLARARDAVRHSHPGDV